MRANSIQMINLRGKSTWSQESTRPSMYLNFEETIESNMGARSL